MKINPMIDMLCLAFSKKKFSQKFFYVLQGIIFTPFLLYEERKQKNAGRNTIDANQAGDDIYPLF